MVMNKLYIVLTEDKEGNMSVTHTKVFPTIGEACTAAHSACSSSMTGTIRYAAEVTRLTAYAREVVCKSVH